MNQLERVQCTFLSFAAVILHIENLPHEYNPVLKRLELTILADGRVSIDQMFLCNLINSSIDYLVLLSQLNFQIPSFHYRATYPFFIPLFTTNYSHNRPIFRMMRILLMRTRRFFFVIVKMSLC